MGRNDVDSKHDAQHEKLMTGVAQSTSYNILLQVWVKLKALQRLPSFSFSGKWNMWQAGFKLLSSPYFKQPQFI